MAENALGRWPGSTPRNALARSPERVGNALRVMNYLEELDRAEAGPRAQAQYRANVEAGQGTPLRRHVDALMADPTARAFAEGFGFSPATIRAFHGSPHRFDRFDMSRIGTGEGAQAYGHGLYFSEAEDVARVYRDTLSRGRGPGTMYEVNLRVDPNRMIDWRAPLAQQPQAVRELFDGGPFDRVRAAAATYRRPEEVVGEHLYTGLATRLQLDGARGFGGVPASQELARRGIPGIRYLDEGSRAAGQGTHNYVIFDDSVIDILRRYGIAALLGGGAAAGVAGAAEARQ
jgi:hypothetical protein